MPRIDTDSDTDSGASEPGNDLEPALDPPVEGLFVAARPGEHILPFDEVRRVMEELKPARGWTVEGGLPGIEWSVDPARLRTEGGALELRASVAGEPRVVAERIAPAAAQRDAPAPVDEASAYAPGGETPRTRPAQPGAATASAPQRPAAAPVRVIDRTVGAGASSRTAETLVIGDSAWDVPVPTPPTPEEIRTPPSIEQVLAVRDVPPDWPMTPAVGLSAGGARERVVRFPEDEPAPP
ncbi:MAG: hypothetical protein EA398_16310 [Deltaproteobacteria bacterium]|nr:MAG: hypothetical protein EA398_16310 [Deltaproteobacteria bacterium]